MSGSFAASSDEAKIDAIFARVDQCTLPGAAVGIAIGGSPVYRKGFGLANIELPVLLTPATRMRIGSTTKHLAALAYMLLCEEGRAGIDDAIGFHVPDLHDATRGATMRQLMGHTSGIRDLLSVALLLNGSGKGIARQDLLKPYATIEDRDFEAGTRWSYNNGGYTLLSAAIEAITGQPLGQVLQERIFAPLGMHDTVLRPWDSDFLPNSATLHSRNAAGVWSRDYMGVELDGGGGMVSTADDMLRWMRHMDAPVVGSPDTWELMRQPQVLTNGRFTGYGLGLITETYRGARIVHHAGGVMGGNSQMIKVPDAGLDITIAVSRSDVNATVLALEVIDACVEGLDPAPLAAEQERRTATFRSSANGRIVQLSDKDGKQWMAVDGGAAMPVLAHVEGCLNLPAAAAFLQQSLRLDGEAAVFLDFGNEDVLEAIETDTDARLGERAGRYRSCQLGGDFVLADGPAGPELGSRGPHGSARYSIVPITADIWRFEQTPCTPMAGILTFAPDSKGFTLDMTRMRHVHFHRMPGDQA